MQDDPNLQLLQAAAQALEPMFGEVVFVGGCVTGLLITDPAVAGVRPTTDVDVIAEVYSYAQYDELPDRLRELELVQDAREGFTDAGPVTISTVMTSKTSLRLSTEEKSWLPKCETHRRTCAATSRTSVGNTPLG